MARPESDDSPTGRPRRGRRDRRSDSLLRGGLLGIAAVTAATLLLAAAGAVVAVVVALFY